MRNILGDKYLPPGSGCLRSWQTLHAMSFTMEPLHEARDGDGGVTSKYKPAELGLLHQEVQHKSLCCLWTPGMPRVGASTQQPALVGNFEREFAAKAELELTGPPKALPQVKGALHPERGLHHSGRF